MHLRLGLHERYLRTKLEVNRLQYVRTMTGKRGVSVDLDKQTKRSTDEQHVPEGKQLFNKLSITFYHDNRRYLG